MRPAPPALLLALLASCAAAPPRPPAVEGMPADDLRAPLSAVWVGHATVLLRFGHATLLTDPNLSDRVLLLPRITRPSLRPGELPPIDAVVLSHPHLDHFDAWTLRQLGPRPSVLFPAEAAPYADEILQDDKLGLSRWQTTERAGLRITAVPARHQGGRYGFDTLWNHACAGWVVEGAGRTVYFAGDTGYDRELFKEIGRRFPGIEVAFIPIAPARAGAPDPDDRWGHVGPELALDIFRDVGARYMAPIHFEAFFSTTSRFEEPRRRLVAEVEKRGLQGRVLAWHTGERLVFAAGGEPLLVGAHRPPQARRGVAARAERLGGPDHLR
jgi:L-ascorbate metabolism protein UlaG (beta-lactamase superfamily)